MTRKIFKYELKNTSGKIVTHKDPWYLCVKAQNNCAVVYVSVDESEPRAEYEYALVQTGGEEPNENDMYYIGTVMLLDGNYVLHAYIKLNGISV
jgi:hypothetical protein